MSRALAPAAARDRLLAGLQLAGHALDRLVDGGLRAEDLDADGRARVDAFLQALAGRVAELRDEITRTSEKD